MINIEFNNILELIQAFPDEQSCIDHLEALRWADGVVSPFDAESKVYNCKGNRYKCKNTGKYFNVKTATLFDNTKIQLQKWFLGIYIVTSHKKGISSIQLSKDIGITQKSAWFMLQRIRKCFNIEDDSKLNGEVEIDETYVGGKNKNRHQSKKVANSQGRSTKDKTPVVGMVQREGKLIAKQVIDVKDNTITDLVTGKVDRGAKVYTDEYRGYNTVRRMFDHGEVKHAAKQYVNGRVHTNTIEGFWSLLKRGIIGIYHNVSEKHLQCYVDEFVFRYNSRNLADGSRMNMMLSHTEVRTTYKALING